MADYGFGPPHWLIFMESTSLTELLELWDVGRKSKGSSECMEMQ